MLKTPTQFVPISKAIEHTNTTTLVFCEDELLIRESDLSFPGENIGTNITRRGHVHPVGMLGNRYFCTTWVESSAEPESGYAFRKLRSLIGALADELMAIAGRAYQIAHWARSHRFCGACSNETVLVNGERCVKCMNCGALAYPRISPAMMVLIRKGDAILLARHASSPTNRFTALAGFSEAGESIEETVHREVFEEVGLKIHNLRYFGSQSWPFPHSLMIAFTADYLSGEIRIDENEIAEARWYEPTDDIPLYASNVSIAGELIDAHLGSILRDKGG